MIKMREVNPTTEIETKVSTKASAVDMKEALVLLIEKLEFWGIIGGICVAAGVVIESGIGIALFAKNRQLRKLQELDELALVKRIGELNRETSLANERASSNELTVAKMLRNDPANSRVYDVSVDLEMYLECRNGDRLTPRISFTARTKIGDIMVGSRGADTRLGAWGHHSFSSRLSPANEGDRVNMLKYAIARDLVSPIQTISVEILGCSVTNADVLTASAIIRINDNAFKKFELTPGWINNEGNCDLQSTNCVDLRDPSISIPAK